MAGGVGGTIWSVCIGALNLALVLTNLIHYSELYFGRLQIESISQPLIHFCRL